MSFCCCLRRRRSCDALIPIIKQAPLKLLENDLGGTHDLSITVQIPSAPVFKQDLRFLITTSYSVTDSEREATVKRLKRFEALTGSKFCAVICYLAPLPANSMAKQDLKGKLDSAAVFPTQAHAFNETQLLLHRHRVTIPLLMIGQPENLASAITTFIKPYTLPTPAPVTRPINAALDILPWCTTNNAPMSRETLVKLTDLCSSMREVASLGEEHVEWLLDEGLGEEDVDGILGFWREEWVAE